MKSASFCSGLCSSPSIKLLVFIAVVITVSCSKMPSPGCPAGDNLPANAFVTPAKAASVANAVCRTLNDQKVPCIQVTIIDLEGNRWTLTMGTADYRRKRTAGNDNLFRIASITKTFTATVILRLAEEGKLSLDDKLISYFPDFINAPDVTIRNLLDHSSGLRELLTLPDILTTSTLFSTKIWDTGEIMKVISTKSLVFPTGTDHGYSNTNYVLLGMIAEKASGKKMALLYNEYIFDLLDTDLLTLLPEDVCPPGLISGYDRDLLPTPGVYEVTPRNTSWASAAFTSGALAGNSEQTAWFFHNLLTGNILTPSSLLQMETFGEKQKPDNEYQRNFGLGLFRFLVNDREYLGHEGLFIGADNIAAVRTEDMITIVILANISSYDKFLLMKEIDDIL